MAGQAAPCCPAPLHPPCTARFLCICAGYLRPASSLLRARHVCIARLEGQALLRWHCFASWPHTACTCLVHKPPRPLPPSTLGPLASPLLAVTPTPPPPAPTCMASSGTYLTRPLTMVRGPSGSPMSICAGRRTAGQPRCLVRAPLAATPTRAACTPARPAWLLCRWPI